MEKTVCEICGKELSEDEICVFGGEVLCGDCLEENTVVCWDCGTRIWADDNAGNDDHPLCQRCYDEGYTTCERCGTLLRWSSALFRADDLEQEEPYCDSCFYRLQKLYIQDYYYKPRPIFYGDGPRYFGVELEIDEGGESDGNAGKLLMIANGEDRECAYCKHDGSLSNGFEIVTHPMSLDYHLRKMPWAELLQEAVHMGYRSHKAGTCGLHIHVSREAFGGTEAEQDAVIARILYFIEKHWDEILRFTRRTQNQMDQWAARYGYQEQPREILDHAKKGYGKGRYSCVNLQNAHTVEFRMFRGTLKLNTLFAALQLVDRLCDVAIALPDEPFRALTWDEFVGSCTAPELVQYLKDRRLYHKGAV